MLAILVVALVTAAGLTTAAVVGASAQTDPTITIVTGGDRTSSSNSATGGNVDGVEGVVYTVTPVGGGQSETCTSDENGNCTVNVQGGRSYMITQTSAPDDGMWMLNPMLGVGSVAVEGQQSVATPYDSITVQVGNDNVTVPAAGSTANTSRSGKWAVSRVNPPPPVACTNKIALIFDLSASITAPELERYKEAATMFVKALEGMNVNVQLFTFGTTAPLPSNDNLTLQNTGTTGGVDNLLNQIQSIMQPTTAQFTNWDRALAQVSEAATDSGVPFGEAIMMTDGDPTAYGTNGNTNQVTSTFQKVENGIFSANQLKAMGTRVVGVGIGLTGAGPIANLQAISGPMPNSDFFTTNFADDNLSNLLTSLANADCASLDLSKTAESSPFHVGQDIEYTYTVTNNSPAADGFAFKAITVEDDQVDGTITNCERNGAPISATNLLAVGESATCTAMRKATQADVDAGQILNTATAHGTTTDGDDVPSNEADAMVTTDRHQDIGITKEADPRTYSHAGQEITYHYVITNTGNVTLKNVMVTDDKIGTDNLDCTPPNDGTATLKPGDKMKCTATYTVTQADVDAGNIMNTATATGTPPPGLEPPTDEATENIISDAAPDIKIVKSASPETYTTVGQVIDYHYTVTNTGHVTLNNVQVSDDKATDVMCTPPIGSPLSPGASLDCTASYTVTQEDIDRGSILNTATTTGTAPDGEDVTDSDTADVHALGSPTISVTKTPDPQTYSQVGQTITYTYVVTNTGPVPLMNVTLTDNRLGSVTCPQATLAVEENMKCTAEHVITQADLDAGSIPNIATVTGTDADGREATDDDDAQVVAEVGKGISVTKTAEPQTYSATGQVIHYTYVVTNIGGVTLTNVTLSDNTIEGPFACDPEEGSALAPGQQMTCTASHTVTQADLDAGSIANVATASGKPPEGDEVTDEADAVVTPTVTEDVQITKTASPLTYSRVGQVITYTFRVVNAGNVTQSNVVVQDDKLGTVSCPQLQLAPGEEMTCTATHTVTEVDIDEGSLPNDVTAEARTPSGQPDESLPKETVVTELRPPEVPVTG